MKIDSNDLAPILTALAGFVTVVGGFVVQIVMMLRQNKKIDEHNTAVRSDIAEIKTATTGTYRALGSGP